MMYIQWLVHGRPDAMKPSAQAMQEADSIISKYEACDDYSGAVEFVGSLGEKFSERAMKFCDRDFYRLRRTLEVALTVKGQRNEVELVQALYTGEREGDLPSLGYDVRCFFLCPDDRMKHTAVIDERCEHMIIEGLLKETTDLILSEEMPEMAKKAIGYRQALEYLTDERDMESESERFSQFLNDFSTATRRYAKQQMAWFRRDKAFVFVPVNLDVEKSERVRAASDAIQRYCNMSRDEYERERDSVESTSAVCKKLNEDQGSKMKFYQLKRNILNHGSLEFEAALSQACGLRKEFQCRKRRRVDQTSPATKEGN
jgi:tRNA dimethylallyltransferase